jgi:uridine kinase
MAAVCVGVSGGSGSGKTAVAGEIARRVGHERVVLINQDRYNRDLAHLDGAHLLRHNFDHPSAIDGELLIEHVRQLKHGQPAELPVYDFVHHRRTAAVERLEPRPVVLVEGILTLAIPELRELFDLCLFVDTDADLRFARRLQRDLAERGRTVDEVITQYLETVRPMHRELVEPSKRWAELIIEQGAGNTNAVDRAVCHIEQLLHEGDG